MRKNDPAYAREMNRVADLIFDEVSRLGWTFRRLAAESGLGIATVWYVGEGKTKCPQYRTVWRLARAVGLDLQISRRRPRMVS